jgi:hypothetical protein
VQIYAWGNADQVGLSWHATCVALRMKQQTPAMVADHNAQYEQHRRPIRCDPFLATMEQIVPWAELWSVIEPHYPKPGNGRPPVRLERMFRMYFVQRSLVLSSSWAHIARQYRWPTHGLNNEVESNLTLDPTFQDVLVPDFIEFIHIWSSHVTQYHTSCE